MRFYGHSREHNAFSNYGVHASKVNYAFLLSFFSFFFSSFLFSQQKPLMSIFCLFVCCFDVALSGIFNTQCNDNHAPIIFSHLRHFVVSLIHFEDPW